MVDPAAKLNVKELGMAEMDDVPPCPVVITFSVTDNVITPLPFPTVTNPPYVPVSRPAGFTERTTAAGVEPEVGLAVSHVVGPEKVVTLNVCVPEVALMFNVCGEGATPFWALKTNCAGFTERVLFWAGRDIAPAMHITIPSQSSETLRTRGFKDWFLH